MKRSFLLLIELSLFTAVSSAAVFTFNSTVGIEVPDGSTTGLANTITIAEGEKIDTVSVILNLVIPPAEFGYTGDLYAYVQHGSRNSILLNRPGRGLAERTGYDDSVPFSVRFDDSAVNGDIHSYRLSLFGDNQIPLSGPLTGAWQPDGRRVNPDIVLSTDARTATLQSFVGDTSQGDWTLYIADLSAGGVYRLENWSLEFQTAEVPEPAAVTLAVALTLILFGAIKKAKARVSQ